MFAVNHAATALLLKKRWTDAPLLLLLLSVQALEMLWVVLNALGVERTTTEARVRFVGDIHLSHMPYSHSLLGAVAIALVAWLLARRAHGSSIALAIGLGVVSHIVLDLVTHAPDIAVAPWSDTKLGLGLYSLSPSVAFFVEFAYGVACWWLFHGSGALLAVIVAFNLANVSMFVPQIPGIERLLAGQPGWIVTLVAVQILVTLALVGWLAQADPRRKEPAMRPPP